jgi:GT2 family glycosyltransferase
MTQPPEDGCVVRLLATSRGNAFMVEVARVFEEGFHLIGVPCRLELDRLPRPPEPNDLTVVVAPHEFFPLFAAREFPPATTERLKGDAFVLNVEQPESQWFELAAQHARGCRGVFDISLEGVQEFRRRGVRAVHTPLGWSALQDPGPGPRPDARPIDVLFFGHASPRREAFFARHASFFSRRHCEILLTDLARPRRAGFGGYLDGGQRSALLHSSKILLTVHSTDRQYFETQRALLALTHRCLLVAESSRGTAPLASGRHFVMASLDDVPAACAEYLDNPTRLTEVATAGRSLAESSLHIEDSCRRMLSARSTEREGPTPSAQTGDTRRRAARARLQSVQAARAEGRQDWQDLTNTAFADAATPAVTVVVSLYNYETHVAQCLTSVLDTGPVAGGIEVIVVDDASTDGSAGVVERMMERASIPMRLLRKAVNTGLADARNLGIDHARGTHVFILDADNWIYPTCLPALHEAITDGVAGAYGLIARFDHETGLPLGVASAFDWDVQELVRSPYLDAMAMFDRDVLRQVQGYSTELIDHGWFGWEDYDLWLKFALAGRVCRRVPRILSAYRVHGASMIQDTNRTTEAIAAHFHDKFRALVARYPDLDRHFGFPSSGAGTEALARRPVDELASRCQALEDEVAALRGSMSWRATAPLRLVFRWLTGRPA